MERLGLGVHERSFSQVSKSRSGRIAAAFVVVVSAGAVLASPARAGVGSAWSLRRRLPQVTQHAGGAVLRRRLYVVGGEDRNNPIRAVQRYDPTSNRWGSRAPLPARRSRVGVAATGDSLFAIGGTSSKLRPTRTLYRYDRASDRWRSRHEMPVALTGIAAAVASPGGDETLFAFGGTDREGTVRDIAYAYRPSSDTWQKLTAMPVALSDASAVSIGGTIYVLGGVGTSMASSRSLMSYDVNSDTWTTLESMRSNAFGAIGAVVGRDGRIYAIGLDWAGKRVDAYDPETDTWTGSPPDLARSQAYPATGRIGRHIYAAGGNPASLTLSSADLESLRVT